MDGRTRRGGYSLIKGRGNEKQIKRLKRGHHGGPAGRGRGPGEGLRPSKICSWGFMSGNPFHGDKVAAATLPIREGGS